MPTAILPRDALFADGDVAPDIPVCDHYCGVELRMRKSLELQAELGPVFDITLDCEDGAPIGGEAEHAQMVAETALSPNNRFGRVGARGHAHQQPGHQTRHLAPGHAVAVHREQGHPGAQVKHHQHGHGKTQRQQLRQHRHGHHVGAKAAEAIHGVGHQQREGHAQQGGPRQVDHRAGWVIGQNVVSNVETAPESGDSARWLSRTGSAGWSHRAAPA